MTVTKLPDLSTARGRVAAEVRASLARHRISGNRLATLTDRSQSFWSRRLTGERPFDIDDLEIVADLLGIDISTFFGGPISSPQPNGPRGGSSNRSGARKPAGYPLTLVLGAAA